MTMISLATSLRYSFGIIILFLPENNGSMWCVLILRSGRFAGAVFDRQTVLTHKVSSADAADNRYYRDMKDG